MSDQTPEDDTPDDTGDMIDVGAVDDVDDVLVDDIDIGEEGVDVADDFVADDFSPHESGIGDIDIVGEDEFEDSPAPKRGGILKILVILVTLALIGGGGWIGYQSFVGTKAGPRPTAQGTLPPPAARVPLPASDEAQNDAISDDVLDAVLDDALDEALGDLPLPEGLPRRERPQTPADIAAADQQIVIPPLPDSVSDRGFDPDEFEMTMEDQMPSPVDGIATLEEAFDLNDDMDEGVDAPPATIEGGDIDIIAPPPSVQAPEEDSGGVEAALGGDITKPKGAQAPQVVKAQGLNAEILSKLDGIATQVETLGATVAGLEAVTADQVTRKDLEKFETSLSNLEQKVTALEQARVVASPAPPRASSASPVGKTADQIQMKTPQPAQNRTSVKPQKQKWILRSVTSGTAWISREDEAGVRKVSVGDAVPGLGTVTDIAQDSGGWVVRTSKGVIRP